MKEARILRWQDEIGTVAERWKQQYYNKGRWGRTAFTESSEVIYQQLLALGPDATPADVHRIIGVDGWVEFWCNGCGKNVPLAMQLGDEPDYESATATLCLPCFDQAVALRQTIDAVDPSASSTGNPSTRDNGYSES